MSWGCAWLPPALGRGRSDPIQPFCVSDGSSLETISTAPEEMGGWVRDCFVNHRILVLRSIWKLPAPWSHCLDSAWAAGEPLLPGVWAGAAHPVGCSIGRHNRQERASQGAGHSQGSRVARSPLEVLCFPWGVHNPPRESQNAGK